MDMDFLSSHSLPLHSQNFNNLSYMHLAFCHVLRLTLLLTQPPLHTDWQGISTFPVVASCRQHFVCLSSQKCGFQTMAGAALGEILSTQNSEETPCLGECTQQPLQGLMGYGQSPCPTVQASIYMIQLEPCSFILAHKGILQRIMQHVRRITVPSSRTGIQRLLHYTLKLTVKRTLNLSKKYRFLIALLATAVTICVTIWSIVFIKDHKNNKI